MRAVPLLFSLVTLQAASLTFDQSLWSELHFRSLGPDRGGRVTTVTGVPSQPQTFYMGSTGGGIWKTTDAGHLWTNVSDGQLPVGSMGAIAVSLTNPNVIYAGTGSSKIRSNVSIGKGIFKSVDAGKTWTFSGLRDAGQIATVRIHPTDPNTVYVASIGNPFSFNKERGVFRTRDGGTTWQNVLHLSDELGAADLELQPGHPEVVFACLWHSQRKPWTIISGAMDGGIYKSEDAGDHWAKLTGGLPSGLFGRSNVALSASKPERLYALIEAKPGAGLYRSEDGGKSWSLINAAANLITRPFYYDTLAVDPNDAEVVYVGDEGWFKSTDGGKSFKSAPVPHGDNHDLWINPTNSEYMIQSNDGGANVSLDGGRSWSTQANQPTAEIYQVAVDNQYPYRVYGAQQDNTTVVIPALALPTGQEYRVGPGCETGPIIPETDRPEVVYGGCKGQFSLLDMNTNDERQYWVGVQSLYGNAGAELQYRFQRVSPMEVSPFDPRTVYYGSQYVHRTRDQGVMWETMSPDLTAHPAGTQGASGEPITRDATGEEVYSTLYSIRESPVQRGLIWTGSNDGLIYVTKDNGKSWTNVTPKGLLPGGRVQNLEPSPHRAGSAYVAIYRYLLGDFSPYLYRTDNFGESWTLLTNGKNGIAPDEPARVIREDPGRPELLYAGTEFGLYLSFDNGANWQSFQLNLPATPVTDIKLAHGDLVLSTQGRGFYVLDDLTPLQQFGVTKTVTDNMLFDPRTAIRSSGRISSLGPRIPTAPQYPATGAVINYFLQQAASEVKMEILDGEGHIVRTFNSVERAAALPVSTETAPAVEEDEDGPRVRSLPTVLKKTSGLHRFTWDLRYPGPWLNAARPAGPNGPMAVPGKYMVRLTSGAWTSTSPLMVIEDPRVLASGVTVDDLQAQFDHNMRVRDLVAQVNHLAADLRAAQKNDLLADRMTALKKLSATVVTPPIRYSKPELQTHITYLYSMSSNTDQKVGADAQLRYNILKSALDAALAEYDKLVKR